MDLSEILMMILEPVPYHSGHAYMYARHGPGMAAAAGYLSSNQTLR